MEIGGYTSKMLYLKNVNGETICEEVEKIEVSNKMRVFATQIFQKQSDLYDVFIHYKVKTDSLEPIKINV